GSDVACRVAPTFSSAPDSAPAGTNCAVSALIGTAYVGTTRRGSQTSRAWQVSATESPPIATRTRFAVGSYRSVSRLPLSRSIILTPIGDPFHLRGGRSTFIAKRIIGPGTESLAESAASAALLRSGVPRPNHRFSGPPVGSRWTCRGGLPSAAPRALEMTTRWISLVPSKMVYSLASRYHFSTGWSLM